jgi:hypothetical protein
MEDLQIGDRVRLARNGSLGLVVRKFKGRAPRKVGVIVRWDDAVYDSAYLLPCHEFVRIDNA